MATYATLLLPSANRVYADSSARLMTAELGVLNRAALEGRISDIKQTSIGGVPYLTFEADELSEADLALLANLSSIYGMFRIEGDLLAPKELHRLDLYDDDLITIQKYQGKTNEQFTKLLLNVTLWSSNFAGEMARRRFSVLDPLGGRGTTLNQAIMYGYDAAGVDIDKRDFEAYSGFIRTYLKRKRLKHQAEVAPVRRQRRVLGRQLEVTLAPSKERYKAGDTQRLSFCNIDTTEARDVYAAGSFDLLVTDAPYGVQHGSRTEGEGLRRAPLDLLRAGLPVWMELLRSGGAMGIAWNTLVAKREEVAAELRAAGLEVFDSGPYRNFEHRVDQAILRDVIVARKP
ncbi:hypothetical protein HNR23_004407 [Nocardiopsis mwathae]|uniref:Uncharacterized protein n=1 Tax=Nocardiopsis mwathae TaxID=1472723 RepID=A0A7X0D777_9ACTN|nr:SAM-dependent methyltransferase [Nocardiopsis mwathae]MBB6174347.1 hypothetical protein [Nocardiopsis mwathae]